MLPLDSSNSAKIAELRGKDSEEIGEITAANFFRFFELPKSESCFST